MDLDTRHRMRVWGMSTLNGKAIKVKEYFYNFTSRRDIIKNSKEYTAKLYENSVHEANEERSNSIL